MPAFPLHIRTTDYVTEHGLIVRAKRAYIVCEFLTSSLRFDAFLDTGASVSIVPYTLFRLVPWVRLAARLDRVTGSGSSALVWQGVPCELGTTHIRCIHQATGQRSAPLHILAKFPMHPAVRSLERTLIFGLSALEDNGGKLHIEQTGSGLSGTV
jgi:hypothetical protein